MRSKTVKFLSVIFCLLSALNACDNEQSQKSLPPETTSQSPLSPIDIQATLKIDRVSLTWQEAENITFYKIYRSNILSGNYIKIGASDHLTFSDLKVEPDRSYFYKISTVKVDKKGVEFESEKSTPLEVTFLVAILEVDSDAPINFGEVDVDRKLTITNSGGRTLNWKITAKPSDWIYFEPKSGNLPGRSQVEVRITAERTIDPGWRQSTIKIEAEGNKPIELEANMVVSENPILALKPIRIDFGLEHSKIQMVEIQNIGTGKLRWEAEKLRNSDWLTIAPLSGEILHGKSEIVIFKLIPKELEKFPAGIKTYDNVKISTPNSSQTIYVTAEVENPIIQVSEMTIELGTDQRVAGVKVDNVGTGKIFWHVKSSTPWITATPDTGITQSESDRVTFSVDREKFNVGEHSETMQIITDNFSTVVTINFQIPEMPLIEVLSDSIALEKNNSAILEVKNIGTGTARWNITSNVSWLSIGENSGETAREEISQIQLTADRNGHLPGEHSAEIKIDAGDAGEKIVAISMEISPPTMVTSKNEIGFGNAQNSTSIEIKNEGEGILLWSAKSSENWLTVSEGNGSLSQGSKTILELSALRNGLPAGEHQAKLEFGGNVKTPQEIPVSLLKIGYLVGTVKNVRTNEPIAGATVDILEVGPSETDENGNFRIPFDKQNLLFTIKTELGSYISREEIIESKFDRVEFDILLTPFSYEVSDIVDLDRPNPAEVAYADRHIYITNPAHDSVTVVDIETNELITEIHLVSNVAGKSAMPIGIIADPVRPKMYVVNAENGNISVIDRSSNREIHQFFVGDYPTNCAISPDGSTLFVTLQRENMVAIVDLSVPTRTNRIPVGNIPNDIEVSSNGDRVYVSNGGDDTVSIIDRQSERVVGKIPVGDRPEAMSIAENGNYLYVINHSSSDLSLIELATETEVDRISLEGNPVEVVAISEFDGREVVHVVNRQGKMTVIEMPRKTIFKRETSASFPIDAVGYDKILDKFHFLSSARIYELSQ